MPRLLTAGGTSATFETAAGFARLGTDIHHDSHLAIAYFPEVTSMLTDAGVLSPSKSEESTMSTGRESRRSELCAALLAKFRNKTAVASVVGLGYVGLPLVNILHKNGLNVVGFDIDKRKVDALLDGKSYIGHIADERVQELVADGRFTPTTDYSRFRDCDTVSICVPTPLTENREPDLSYIVDTGKALGPYLRRGQLIVLESTTYPGTTREVLIPILEEISGLKAGDDFLVAFSPEREDPGNPTFSTHTIPKVVGGLDNDSLEVAVALYEHVSPRVVAVSSLEVAEACKILENTYRAVNIALVNELKILFDRMDCRSGT